MFNDIKERELFLLVPFENALEEILLPPLSDQKFNDIRNYLLENHLNNYSTKPEIKCDDFEKNY